MKDQGVEVSVALNGVAKGLLVVSTSLVGIAAAISVFPFRWVQAQSLTSSEAKNTADRHEKVLGEALDAMKSALQKDPP